MQFWLRYVIICQNFIKGAVYLMEVDGVKQQRVSACALACACVLSLSVGAYADIIDSSSAVSRFAETASTFSGVTPSTGTWAGTNDVAYVEADTIFFDIVYARFGGGRGCEDGSLRRERSYVLVCLH